MFALSLINMLWTIILVAVALVLDTLSCHCHCYLILYEQIQWISVFAAETDTAAPATARSA